MSIKLPIVKKLYIYKSKGPDILVSNKQSLKKTKYNKFQKKKKKLPAFIFEKAFKVNNIWEWKTKGVGYKEFIKRVNTNKFRYKKKFQKKKKVFSFFNSPRDRYKALNVGYDFYREFQKELQFTDERLTEPRHFVLSKVWANSKKDFKKNLFEAFKNNSLYESKGFKFKRNRSNKQYKSVFRLLTENRPFWSVDWWKTKFTVISNNQWNSFKKKKESIEYQRFYTSYKRYKRIGYKNFGLKRLKGRAVHFFIKVFFKLLITRIFHHKFKKIIAGNISQVFFLYKQIKLFCANYASMSSLIFNKDATAAQEGAYFLSNLAFSKIYFGEKADETSLYPYYQAQSWSEERLDKISTAYLVKGPSGRLHSSYYKFNSFLFTRFLLINIKRAFNFKNKLEISNLLKLVNGLAKKKITKKKITEVFIKKKKTLLKKSFYTRVYFSLLLLSQTNFHYKLNRFQQDWISKNVLFPNEERLVKTIIGARGYFYHIRKRIPKYFKSNKKLKLFKQFVRRYKYSSRAAYNFKKVIGVPSHYFQVVGVTKQFKQKIYYRAMFKHKYAAKDDTKMYNRWKYIKRDSSIWIGFYKNFEGHLWRALRWLGFSNKIKLSKFLIENGLIFINGRVITNPRRVIDKEDLVYLRKDIYLLIQKKIWNFLIKRAISAVPFYNTILKEKLVKKSARLYKAFLRNSAYTSSMDENIILRFKEILRKANFNILKKNYGVKSYPNLILDRKQWRRHLKKVSAFKLNLLKKMSQSKRILHSANADYTTYPNNEAFMFKKKNMVMIYAKPRTVYDFFNTSAVKYKKTFNPRVIKDFSERNYKY